MGCVRAGTSASRLDRRPDEEPGGQRQAIDHLVGYASSSAGLSARRRQGHHVGGLAVGAEDAPQATAPGGRIDATPQSSMGLLQTPSSRRD